MREVCQSLITRCAASPASSSKHSSDSRLLFVREIVASHSRRRRRRRWQCERVELNLAAAVAGPRALQRAPNASLPCHLEALPPFFPHFHFVVMVHRTSTAGGCRRHRISATSIRRGCDRRHSRHLFRRRRLLEGPRSKTAAAAAAACERVSS